MADEILPYKNFAQLLLGAFYWVDETLQIELANRGLPAVTRAQSMLFVQIGAGLSSPIEIARVLGVSKQAVHKTISELNKLNLLELHPDPNDGRAKIIVPTGKGVELGIASRDILYATEKKLAERIGKANAMKLREILELDWGDV